MCLVVNPRKKRPTKVTTVYKEVYIRTDGSIITQYMGETVKPGWLKAERPLTRARLKARLKKDRTNQDDCTIIEEGAIHAHSKPQYHRQYSTLLKCKAYPRDFIAHGISGDVCYRKIFIPAEEIIRVLQECIEDKEAKSFT
jgi:hypothetical protein